VDKGALRSLADADPSRGCVAFLVFLHGASLDSSFDHSAPFTGLMHEFGSRLFAFWRRSVSQSGKRE
jgi:hypothetical protein